MIGDIQRGAVQTSFIPKKPLTSFDGKEGAGISAIFKFLSIIVFVIALSVYGGGLFYVKVLNSSIATLNSELNKVQAALKDRDLVMKEMVKFDSKLNNVSMLLERHISLRNLFAFLEENTMSRLRFNEFSYLDTGNGSIDLRLSGEAKSYGTIANQSREFINSKKFGDKDFTDIIFSDFNPGLTGNVVFKATAKVMPELVYYKNLSSIKGNL